VAATKDTKENAEREVCCLVRDPHAWAPDSRHKTRSAPTMLRLDRLPKASREALWNGIQEQAPELADLMANDPNVAALREMFGAQYLLPEERVDALLALQKKEVIND